MNTSGETKRQSGWDFQKVWIDTLLARRCSLFGCWRHFDRKTLNSACHTRRRTLSDSIGFSSRWDPLHHFGEWIAHFWSLVDFSDGEWSNGPHGSRSPEKIYSTLRTCSGQVLLQNILAEASTMPSGKLSHLGITLKLSSSYRALSRQ